MSQSTEEIVQENFEVEDDEFFSRLVEVFDAVVASDAPGHSRAYYRKAADSVKATLRRARNGAYWAEEDESIVDDVAELAERHAAMAV